MLNRSQFVSSNNSLTRHIFQFLFVSVKNEKKVQFNDEVKVLDSEKGPASNVEPVPVVIDENKIDRLLHLLQEADPQSDKQDSDELLTLEGENHFVIECC